jgi:acyl carrier protein
MKAERIRNVVLSTLGQIAPEADLGSLEPDRGFRDQFDFDSVDFLNFALALQERVETIIPEEDYPSLTTLNGCIAYLLMKACKPFPSESSV